MSRLIVATFNIHHCEGADGVIDIDRTAGAILETGAEVVALQEIDVGMERSGKVDQQAALADATGLSISFHPTVRTGNGGLYGIGLAGPAGLEILPVALPRHRPEDEPRAVLVAVVGELTVLVTHLSVKPPSRIEQFEAIADLAHSTEGPVCLLGDLNQEVDDSGPLAGAGLTGPRPPDPTFISRGTRLDHILAGGGASVEEVWVVPSDASDHRPLGGWLSL